MMAKTRTPILKKSTALALAGVFCFSSVSYALRPVAMKNRMQPSTAAPDRETVITPEQRLEALLQEVSVADRVGGEARLREMREKHNAWERGLMAALQEADPQKTFPIWGKLNKVMPNPMSNRQLALVLFGSSRDLTTVINYFSTMRAVISDALKAVQENTQGSAEGPEGQTDISSGGGRAAARETLVEAEAILRTDGRVGARLALQAVKGNILPPPRMKPVAVITKKLQEAGERLGRLSQGAGYTAEQKRDMEGVSQYLARLINQISQIKDTDEARRPPRKQTPRKRPSPSFGDKEPERLEDVEAIKRGLRMQIGALERQIRETYDQRDRVRREGALTADALSASTDEVVRLTAEKTALQQRLRRLELGIFSEEDLRLSTPASPNQPLPTSVHASASLADPSSQIPYSQVPFLDASKPVPVLEVDHIYPGALPFALANELVRNDTVQEAARRYIAGQTSDRELEGVLKGLVPNGKIADVITCVRRLRELIPVPLVDNITSPLFTAGTLSAI